MSAHTLAKRANEALDVNYHAPAGYPGAYVNYAGGYAPIAITVRGSDWYWTVCACMIFSSFVFVGLSLTKPRSHRLFHYITAGITMVASIAYFSMASGIGWTPITAEFPRNKAVVAGHVNPPNSPILRAGAFSNGREIFYVRYIDWAITTPLLLMDLLLTAGLPWPTVAYTILIDEIMIVTGLVGALVRSSYKWGYWTFGMFALFFIGYVLLFEGRSSSRHLGSDIGKTFLLCGAWTYGLWMLYPVAWGLCEGGNVISPDSEAIFYGILDLLAKPVFGGLLLWGHRNIEPSRLGLHLVDYDEKPAITGTTKGPKEAGIEPATNGTSNGVTNGTTPTATV